MTLPTRVDSVVQVISLILTVLYSDGGEVFSFAVSDLL